MKMRSTRSTVTPARPSPLSGISDAGSSEARLAEPRTGTRRMARWSGRVTLLAGLMAALAFPVMAQDGTGPMPLNAQVRSYGTGWICNLGYRVDGADCVALDIPEHAYPTGRSYGSGWECDRGYEQVSGISCRPIPVPENAYLRASGYDWDCERGFRRTGKTCAAIDLPDNGYLTNTSLAGGWACQRGFTAEAGACRAIVVPENGYLPRLLAQCVLHPGVSETYSDIFQQDADGNEGVELYFTPVKKAGAPSPRKTGRRIITSLAWIPPRYWSFET